jgi:hypothetical protein
MKPHAIWACLLMLGGAANAQGGAVAIDLPPDRVEFHPAPGVDTVRSNCITCHSAQYVYTQPPLTRDQWQAEVTKMRNAYGAPIPAEADKEIVDYLYGQNGKQAAGGADAARPPR